MAERGLKALEAKDYPTAILEFTQAIKNNPKGFNFYIKRSTAYQRSQPAQYVEALQDAEIAVKIGLERQRREQIAESQMRRAMVLYGLERYGDAKSVLGFVRQKNEKEKALQVWENMVDKKLSGLPEGDPRAEVTVVEIPETAIPTEAELKGSEAPQKERKADTPPPASPAPVQAVPSTPAAAVKHDWYQTTEKVIIEIKAKGVPSAQTTVEILEHSVSVSFPTIGNSTYDMSLDPLAAAIKPSNSSYKITAYKIEISLQKAVPGQKWAALEGGPSTTPATTANLQAVQSAAAKQKETAPTYPTSSKKGPTDWEKIDVEEDDKEGGEPDDFFKMLFKNADPNTRKAMIKSYTESNGTALSTNWEDVSKGPVETSPPDGMVAKKWDGN